ncbi:MAG: hypothetical protein J6Y02_07290 [Pseudobutyrivibrio sp.]|nr:hypothetical protein [Pseudobutyrivibrio sp.]
MKTWSELHEVLSEIMGENGNVYFQPPENLKIKYPCIVFERTNALTTYADNNPYQVVKRYTVTLITKSADNDQYLDKLLMLPMCTFDRQFVTEGLVHDVFNIYY